VQTLFFIFLSAAAIQVIYFAVFLIALSRKGHAETSEPQPVSIIVCAHDEEQNLRELIPALLKQDHPAFELVIVNDRSNDGTFDFLLEETRKDPLLKMVNIESTPAHVNGKKFAITLGIKAAKYDWVLLTDADCRPHTDQWIKSVSQHFNTEKEFALGYSAYIKKPGFLNLFIRFETLFTAIQYLGCALTGNPYMGVGRNLAYRKTVFLNNKGFNNFLSVTGGDDDLFVNQHATAKNTGVALGPDALVYSIPKTTLKEFYRQKVRHLSVGKKYRMKHQLLLSFFFLTHLLTWFLGLPLLLTGVSAIIWVASALVFRTLLFSITAHQAALRFGQKFEWAAVPLLDFLFVIYYLSTAPVALLTKRIRWKS
jgi:cellulose synthase/poly-beta-1,6-N-acetylglucosamine synthase-like glycosyltransferase